MSAVDRLLSRYFTRSVDGFVAMSESVLEDLGQFDTAKPRLRPHPLYDNFGPRLRKGVAQLLGLDPQRYVLFFRLILRLQRLDTILRAYATAAFGNGCTLIVAGGSTAVRKYRTEKELGLKALWSEERFCGDSE